jgi:biopolymer transport protein ExbD
MRDGALLFGGVPVTETELVSDLRSAVQANPDVSVIITADSHAFHGSVVHVVDLAKIEGVSKFAINVDRSK